MADSFVVAIAGATGAVGNEMISILTERSFPFSEVRLLASQESKGEVYDVGGKEAVVDTLGPTSFDGVDIALFATSAALSAQYAPVAVEAGAWVIDNSSHFRMHDNIPLVVPEVNGHQLKGTSRIIANPNCSTIQLMPVLKCLNQVAGLQRVVVSTYQAVSGAGRDALEELFEQTRAIFNQHDFEPQAFAHQIAFNCIPQIDVFLDNGYTKEEFKIINESKKILELPQLRVTATAVRVPVFHSHAETVNVELERECSPEAFKQALSEVPGVIVCEHDADYPMQIGAAGRDEVFVGRIRKDTSLKHGLDFWVVSDNLRKGAALNAIQIAEELVKLGLVQG